MPSIRPQIMTIIKFISVLFILSACKTKTTQNTLVQKSNSIVKGTFSLMAHFSFIDTLNKYEGLDTLSRGDTLFYIGTDNARPFGLIQNNDSSFKVYQKNKNTWYVSDIVRLSDIANVSYSDLNGDSYKDVLITQDITGTGGNSENVVLLYDIKTGAFVHNQSYDLPNIKFDTKSRLIYSAWWASANNPQDKMVYKFSADSLTLDKGVTYLPDEQTKGKNGTVEFYIERNNRRIVTNKTTGKADKIFQIFSKAYSDTTNE